MNLLKFFHNTAAVCFLLTVLRAEEPIDLEDFKGRIAQTDNVADICIFEQEWINPKQGENEATLIQHAVVTVVHKGTIPVGTKLEIRQYVVNPPKFFRDFRSLVDGELKVIFFSMTGNKVDHGKYVLEFNHWSFDTCRGDFAQTFQEALKKKPKSEQAVAPNGP